MVAANFAWFFGKIFHDPALYTVTVPMGDVLFYSNERNEEEFIVMLSSRAKPVQITLPDREAIEQWRRTRKLVDVKEWLTESLDPAQNGGNEGTL